MQGTQSDLGPLFAWVQNAIRSAADQKSDGTITAADLLSTGGVLDATMASAVRDALRDGVVSIGFGPPSRGLASWIDVRKPVVRLGPHADAAVPFAVRTPEPAAQGELAAIVAQSRPEGSGGIDLVQRVAVLVRPSAHATAGDSRAPLRTGAWAAAVLVVVAGALAASRRERRVRSPAASPASAAWPVAAR